MPSGRSLDLGTFLGSFAYVLIKNNLGNAENITKTPRKKRKYSANTYLSVKKHCPMNIFYKNVIFPHFHQKWAENHQKWVENPVWAVPGFGHFLRFFAYVLIKNNLGNAGNITKTLRKKENTLQTLIYPQKKRWDTSDEYFLQERHFPTFLLKVGQKSPKVGRKSRLGGHWFWALFSIFCL